jgi:hypothetical protein
MGMQTAGDLRIRVKRFQRADTPPGFALTERDLRLLANVARHRFLSSAHLCALDGGSPQNVLRCLRALYDHGYLDRPAAQLATVPISGPRPFVYALGRKGAQALREYGHLINARVDWTEKNKRAGAVFMEHTLAVADFMTGLELACRTRGEAALMREEDVLALAPVETRAARARSAKETFLFINFSFELAGNSTCLAHARAWLPAQRPVKRAVKGLPLDGELRCYCSKERGEERVAIW